MRREEIPCALEQVDGQPDLEGVARKCAQCALVNRVTVVCNVDGITEFKAGSCFMVSEASAMIYEAGALQDPVIA